VKRVDGPRSNRTSSFYLKWEWTDTASSSDNTLFMIGTTNIVLTRWETK